MHHSDLYASKMIQRHAANKSSSRRSSDPSSPAPPAQLSTSRSSVIRSDQRNQSTKMNTALKKNVWRLAFVFFIIFLCSTAGLASHIMRDNVAQDHLINQIAAVTAEAKAKLTRINQIELTSNGSLAVDPSPSLLKKSVPDRNDLSLSCGVEGPIDKRSYEVIQKIRRGIISNQKTLKAIAVNEARPRILCLVYTHGGAHSTLQVLVDTWATQCDGFIAASNATDPSIGAFDLKHDGPEAYGNMWQKVRSL